MTLTRNGSMSGQHSRKRRLSLRQVFETGPRGPLYVGTFFSPYELKAVRDFGPVCVIVTGGGGIEPMRWTADWSEPAFRDYREAERRARKSGWDGRLRRSGSAIGAGRNA